MRWLLPIAALLAWGCTDRTRPTRPIEFEPPAADAGVDLWAPPLDDPDGICDGLADGSSCSVVNGRGVCAAQRCVLVACDTGFGDCAPLPGCETDLSRPEDCGACDHMCAATQRCQPGSAGFVCAAGVVCPTDRFDLDDDPANGCEWQARWGTPYALEPIDFEIEATGDHPMGILVAGGAGDQRLSGLLGEPPTAWLQPRGDARALSVMRDERFEVVTWTDGVAVRRVADGMQVFLLPPCMASPRFVAAAGEYVATPADVLRVVADCDEDVACLRPILSRGAYLQARAATFGADELAVCDACVFQAPGACAEPAPCRAPDFDDSVCGTCTATGCPTLDIAGLRDVEDGVVVVTARGLLHLGTDSTIDLGWERAFDPQSAGGPRFVGAVGGREAPLTLLHSEGWARVLDGQFQPRFPDIGLGLDPQVSGIAAFGEILVTVSAGDAALLRPGPRSGRRALLEMTSAPGVQGLAPHITVSGDGAAVLYGAAGLVYPRHITRD